MYVNNSRLWAWQVKLKREVLDEMRRHGKRGRSGAAQPVLAPSLAGEQWCIALWTVHLYLLLTD